MWNYKLHRKESRDQILTLFFEFAFVDLSARIAVFQDIERAFVLFIAPGALSAVSSGKSYDGPDDEQDDDDYDQPAEAHAPPVAYSIHHVNLLVFCCVSKRKFHASDCAPHFGTEAGILAISQGIIR
jgi:hypothetical protein